MAIICREHKLLFIMVPGTGCSVVGKVLQKQYGGEWIPAKNIVQAGKVVVQKKHNTLEQILQHRLLTPVELEEYLVVATVRNPFDRFVTYYQRLIGGWTEEFFAWHMRNLNRERDRLKLTEEEYAVRRAQHERMVQRRTRRVQVMRWLGFNNWMKATGLRWFLQAWRDRPSIDRSRLLHVAYPMLEGVDVVMRYECLEEAFNEVLHLAGIHNRVTLPRKNITPGKRAYTKYYTPTTRRLIEYLLRDELAMFGHQFEEIRAVEPLVHLTNRRLGHQVMN